MSSAQDFSDQVQLSLPFFGKHLAQLDQLVKRNGADELSSAHDFSVEVQLS